MTDDILVFGMTNVGLPLACLLAETGYKVYGIEKHVAKLQMAQHGVPPYPEPGLDLLLTDAQHNLDVKQQVAEFEELPPVIIVCMDTIAARDGTIDHSETIQALDEIGAAIGESDVHHTVVICSTVLPGFTQRVAVKHLEETSKKKADEHFHLACVPLNVNIGTVITDLRGLNCITIGMELPQLIGTSGQSESTYNVVSDIFDKIVQGGRVTSRVSFINAELSKLAYDCYVATRVSYANQLAMLCERLQGADVDRITDVVSYGGSETHHGLTGGAPYGGTILPTAVNSMLSIANIAGVGFPIVNTARASNDALTSEILQMIVMHLLRVKHRRVGILGLSYKPGVPYQTNSLGSNIARRLRELGGDAVQVKTYDPLTTDIDSMKSAQACVNSATVILVANNDVAYRGLQYKEDQLVIDCWRLLDGEAVKGFGAMYVPLGRGV